MIFLLKYHSSNSLTYWIFHVSVMPVEYSVDIDECFVICRLIGFSNKIALLIHCSENLNLLTSTQLCSFILGGQNPKLIVNYLITKLEAAVAIIILISRRMKLLCIKSYTTISDTHSKNEVISTIVYISNRTHYK